MADKTDTARFDVKGRSLKLPAGGKTLTFPWPLSGYDANPEYLARNGVTLDLLVHKVQQIDPLNDMLQAWTRRDFRETGDVTRILMLLKRHVDGMLLAYGKCVENGAAVIEEDFDYVTGFDSRIDENVKRMNADLKAAREAAEAKAAEAKAVDAE